MAKTWENVRGELKIDDKDDCSDLRSNHYQEEKKSLLVESHMLKYPHRR